MTESSARQIRPSPRERSEHAGTATPIVMFVVLVLGCAGAYVIQKRGADDAPWSAVLPAALAGIRR